jgi:internalin A
MSTAGERTMTEMAAIVQAAKQHGSNRLDLSGYAMTELPTDLCNLKNLEELVLRDNRLTTLPPQIKNLRRLKLLNLDDNYLPSLPAELCELDELKDLHLDSNHLTRLPKSIGQLVGLRSLTLNSNKLEQLPDEICQLQYLQSLMLSNNKLAELPSELGLLRKLQRLWADGNRLGRLPDSICALTELERLQLNDNLIDRLPSKIGDLTRLKTLSLSRNVLTGLVDDISRLPRLETLNLSTNLLTRLPAAIGEIRSLRELRLDDNRLNGLPRELAPLLTNGLTLSFKGNPVSDGLIEIAARGVDALAAYLMSLNDAVAQYEAKVLLVGEGNVGKTSLVAALHGERFMANRSTTHGIRIRALSVRHPSRPLLSMRLRTWDFGGQEIYRITHQFFFSKRALYLLVWSAREGQEQDEVEGWLSRIRLRVAGEAPTIIVATHCGERNAEIDMGRLNQLYPDFIAGMFEIDNSTGLGIAELEAKIAQEAAKLPQMGQLISRRWMTTRDELTALAGEHPQISFAEFTEICRRNDVAAREVRALAELLHDLGQVIYYGDDDGLRDVVVLDPEWLTRAISYVLEDKSTRDAAGVLSHRRLAQIWADRPDGMSYLPRYHPYFLRLMEKFDISYRLDDVEGRSLVAQLVPHRRPILPWQVGSPAKAGLRSLKLMCQLSEPAPGLMAWLTVRHHRSSTGRHWRRGVFLRYEISAYASEAVVELIDATNLVMEVRAPSPDLFFNVLRDSVENLITSRWPGIKYRLQIPCPGFVDDDAPCTARFALDGLLRFRENGGTVYPCLECQSAHDVGRLLTGFELQQDSPVAKLEELQQQLAAVAGGVERLEGIAADTAESVRRVLRLASTEVLDCPRLFSLTRSAGTGVRRAKKLYKQSYRLILWCEHTGRSHPWWTASYEISDPREWLLRVRPYALIVYAALKVVIPVAAAIPELAIPGGNKSVGTDLSAMAALLANLPTAAHFELAGGSGGQLTAAEGEALRSFRVFLFERDRERAFGGLRRVVGPSGEVLWVCPHHLEEYDPGLPEMP